MSKYTTTPRPNNQQRNNIDSHAVKRKIETPQV